MTHYTVLVRFEGELEGAKYTIEKMLAPYSENLEVPRYKVYLTKEDVERMAKHYKINPKNLQKLAERMEDWDGCLGDVDEKGLFRWSTYNPNSKWDWYSIGGRWSGSFKLKKNKVGIKGEAGVYDNQIGIDIAYAKDIDWEAMREERLKHAKKTWQEYIKKVNKIHLDKPSIKETEKRINTEKWLYNIRGNETKEEYINRKQSAFATCSVLDKNGWHEASKMGWFGMDYDRTESKENWEDKFSQRFLQNFTDKTILAIVDCHI